MNEFPGIIDYAENLKIKFINDFAPPDSIIRKTTLPISESAHFELLKNKINQLLLDFAGSPFLEDEILCLTILTPKYPEEIFEYFLTPDLLNQIVSHATILPNPEKLLHSFIQFLLSQEIHNSLKLIDAISNLLPKSEVLIRLKEFWMNLNLLSKIASHNQNPNSSFPNNLDNGITQKVSTICKDLREYRDTRKKSISLIPLPYFVFFPIIHHLSQILCDVDSKDSLPLLTLLGIEPFFAYAMVEKLPRPISFYNLPPLSMVYQVQVPIPHSFLSMYRPILVQIFDLLGLFTKYECPEQAYMIQETQSNTENSIPDKPFKLMLLVREKCRNFLNAIESGPVGRDALTLCLLSLYRAEHCKFNYIAKRFYHYISLPNYHSIEHDMLVSGFLFAFDSVPFPSTNVLLESEPLLFKTLSIVRRNHCMSLSPPRIPHLKEPILEQENDSISDFLDENDDNPENSPYDYDIRKKNPFSTKIDSIVRCVAGNDPGISLLSSAYSLIHTYSHEKPLNSQTGLNKKQKAKRRTRRITRVHWSRYGNKSYRVNNNAMSVLRELSTKLTNPDHFIAFCALVQAHAKKTFSGDLSESSRSLTKYASAIALKLMSFPTNNLPPWHYFTLLKENALVAIDKAASFDHLVMIMKDPLVSANSILGSAYLMDRILSNSKANLIKYISVLQEGKQPIPPEPEIVESVVEEQQAPKETIQIGLPFREPMSIFSSPQFAPMKQQPVLDKFHLPKDNQTLNIFNTQPQFNQPVLNPIAQPMFNQQANTTFPFTQSPSVGVQPQLTQINQTPQQLTTTSTQTLSQQSFSQLIQQKMKQLRQENQLTNKSHQQNSTPQTTNQTSPMINNNQQTTSVLNQSNQGMSQINQQTSGIQSMQLNQQQQLLDQQMKLNNQTNQLGANSQANQQAQKQFKQQLPSPPAQSFDQQLQMNNQINQQTQLHSNSQITQQRIQSNQQVNNQQSNQQIQSNNPTNQPQEPKPFNQQPIQSSQITQPQLNNPSNQTQQFNQQLNNQPHQQTQITQLHTNNQQNLQSNSQPPPTFEQMQLNNTTNQQTQLHTNNQINQQNIQSNPPSTQLFDQALQLNNQQSNQQVQETQTFNQSIQTNQQIVQPLNSSIQFGGQIFASSQINQPTPQLFDKSLQLNHQQTQLRANDQINQQNIQSNTPSTENFDQALQLNNQQSNKQTQENHQFNQSIQFGGQMNQNSQINQPTPQPLSNTPSSQIFDQALQLNNQQSNQQVQETQTFNQSIQTVPSLQTEHQSKPSPRQPFTQQLQPNIQFNQQFFTQQFQSNDQTPASIQQQTPPFQVKTEPISYDSTQHEQPPVDTPRNPEPSLQIKSEDNTPIDTNDLSTIQPLQLTFPFNPQIQYSILIQQQPQLPFSLSGSSLAHLFSPGSILTKSILPNPALYNKSKKANQPPPPFLTDILSKPNSVNNVNESNLIIQQPIDVSHDAQIALLQQQEENRKSRNLRERRQVRPSSPPPNAGRGRGRGRRGRGRGSSSGSRTNRSANQNDEAYVPKGMTYNDIKIHQKERRTPPELINYDFSRCYCFSMSYLTNCLTKLAMNELPQCYRSLLSLTNFSHFSINHNDGSEINCQPVFEDCLMNEIERLSKLSGYRFFFRISTALMQTSSKFPDFLTSFPHHARKYLDILNQLISDSDEKEIPKFASFIWIWRSLGFCIKFSTLYRHEIVELIKLSYQSDPNSEFFFKSLSIIIINYQLAQTTVPNSLPDEFVKELNMQEWKKTPLFTMFIQSLPHRYNYLISGNPSHSNEDLDVPNRNESLPIEKCVEELTGRLFVVPYD